MWPCWSGDSKTVFYTSEREGLATVWKQPRDGGRPTQVVTHPPDAVRWLAIARSGSDLVYECDDRIGVTSAKGGPVTAPPILCRTDERGPHAAYTTYSGSNVSEYELSPDGRRMAFVVRGDIFVVTIEKGGEAKRLTDNPTRDGDMAWSPDGKKLAFRSNRYHNRDIETINDSGRYTLYTVPLEREKEKFDEDEDAPKPAGKPADKPGEKKEDKPVVVKAAPQEIERRAKQIVGLDEGIGAYSVSPDGKTVVFTARSLGTSDLWQVGTDGGAVQRLTTNGTSIGDFEWAPDSSRFYFLSGGAIHWLPRGGGAMGTVGFTVRMEIDRLVDYKATFDEAWQNLNDRYYDPKFHGADWNALRQKYRTKVDYVTVRPDFNYLMTELLGELNSSHTGFSGGGSRPARETGYLGIWHDDAYAGPGIKVRTVLHRSPADHEESRLNAGDYILSIDGQEVQADSTCDKALTEKVGRTVPLLVNNKADKTGARTVKIKPIGYGEGRNLLYEKWLEGRDMENWGVPPDILVENTPAAYLAGHDTQLERAAQELLKDPRLLPK